jgi:hypothetical protein
VAATPGGGYVVGEGVDPFDYIRIGWLVTWSGSILHKERVTLLDAQ